MAREPPKYELLPEEKTREMLKLFKGERTGFVLVGPKKYFFPFRYIEQGAGFYNFEARPDDTWILSHPRSAPWSPYWAHLKEAWALRNNKNLLFMFYEEMTHDFPKAIKKVAKFLNKTYTDEEVSKVVDYLDIKNFRNNPMVNYSELKACGIIAEESFVRKGGTNWKNIFTAEINAKADKWIEENLIDTDLRFPFFNNNNKINNKN
ncbi:Estrogen sulfotransferase [Temnothorax longispinosus]|uniref:Estrogen sulfotransferase n=1 Tax=Temnothorax longispinosus TaxID=300112 RepID=A0A4V3S6B3_9HYME|nr:Estrogen sulfotransferase [Temnothorax longispinosus]